MPATTISHRQPRAWLKISITVSAAVTEQVAAFVATLSEGGVEISMPSPDQTPESDLETVTGYLTDDETNEAKEAELHAFLAELARQNPDAVTPVLASSRIEEEDWGRNWKEHFKPIRITPRITIRPSWEEYLPGNDEIVIEMDPGMAFGTGHHASTHLALEFIDQTYGAQSSGPQRVLDVGTGTGVLAMACALFGAAKVVAIDNDPDAVAAAEENVARNDLAQRMTTSGRDLATITGPFDLVIANITSNVLTELAPLLVKLLAHPGRLILAGILRGEQEDGILATYTALGLRHAATRHREEWASLCLER